MRIFTSNYARFGNHPNAVSISVYVPKTCPNLRHYPSLAPTWDLVNKYKNGVVDNSGYISEYLDILESRGILTGKDILPLVQDGDVLLCFEKADDFCHRQIVAQLLRDVGVDVVELKSYNDYNHFMNI